MTILRVWAPAAGVVEAEVDGERHGMTAGSGGWWELSLPPAADASDYAFVLDGGQPLPDPRSAWQPHGVHGPSRVVDHGAFEWHDQAWHGRPLAGSVVYELHVGTFSPEGTFDAVVDRLDHLVDLGVDFVELLPVNAFPGERGWGYEGVALFAVQDAYGGPDALKRLVDACHARGLGVLLDVVYNHLGPSGNYLGRFGPYFTDRYRTPWGPAVNYDDAGSDEVRRFVVDNALLWLRDYHVDGLRLDAVHAIVDASAVHLLEELAAEVGALSAALGRTLVLIAESDLNDPRIVRPAAAGGYGIDAQWSDDFHHALHAALTGERDGYYADFGSLDDLAAALTGGYVYTGQRSDYRGRRHGRPFTGLSGHRLLGYLQDHDQVGNRALGERTSALLSRGRLEIGAALVLTSPFTPMLWMGEEWGASTPWQFFTDHDDPDLAEGVRVGRREEFAAFGWDPAQVPDPQAVETFERSRLDWTELDEEDHAALLAWHRRLIQLRRTAPALADGDMEAVQAAYDEDERWLVVRRGDLAVVVNLAEAEQRVPVGEPVLDVLLSSREGFAFDPSGVTLAGESVVIAALAGQP
jgi:maltooligosyltrehalose trehalohydrolase